MPVTNLLKPGRVMPASDPRVQARRMICLTCDQRTVGRVLGLLPGEIGAQCRRCSCIIVLKTRCLDEVCEAGKWRD